MQKQEEVNILVDRAKIVSLITALQLRKLTLEQAYELERLLVKERNRAIQNGDCRFGYNIRILFGRIERVFGRRILSQRIDKTKFLNVF
jgi:hypothetical protein